MFKFQPLLACEYSRLSFAPAARILQYSLIETKYICSLNRHREFFIFTLSDIESLPRNGYAIASLSVNVLSSLLISFPPCLPLHCVKRVTSVVVLAAKSTAIITISTIVMVQPKICLVVRSTIRYQRAKVSDIQISH